MQRDRERGRDGLSMVAAQGGGDFRAIFCKLFTKKSRLQFANSKYNLVAV